MFVFLACTSPPFPGPTRPEESEVTLDSPGGGESAPDTADSHGTTHSDTSTVPAPPPVILADFDSELRETTPREDGILHVDSSLLLSRLQALGVDTYAFLVYHSPTDWDDLSEFLAIAEPAGLRTWLYLVNPSEQPEVDDYPPHEEDYVAWARAANELAVAYPSLSAIAIDDFSSGGAFGDGYVCEFMQEAPDLAFYAVEYEQNVLADFNTAEERACVDGIIFPYMDLDDNAAFRTQIEEIAALRNPIPAALRISFPWNVPSEAGQFGRHVTNCTPGTVTFGYDDGFFGATTGYHIVRARSGGEVVFEEDVAGSETGDQVSFSVGEGPLAIGIEEERGVGNFGVEVTLVGLTAPTCGAWSWEESGDAFSGDIGDIPGWTGMELYPMVYAEGTSWHRRPPTPEVLGEAVDIALQASEDGLAQGVITYCVPKEDPDHERFMAVAQRYHQE